MRKGDGKGIFKVGLRGGWAGVPAVQQDRAVSVLVHVNPEIGK